MGDRSRAIVTAQHLPCFRLSTYSNLKSSRNCLCSRECEAPLASTWCFGGSISEDHETMLPLVSEADSAGGPSFTRSGVDISPALGG